MMKRRLKKGRMLIVENKEKMMIKDVEIKKRIDEGRKK